MAAVSLQPFSFPVPETRFFEAGGFVYKFKIRGGNSLSEDEVLEDDGIDQEMEEIVRTILGDLDRLQPFFTSQFIVFPYKRSLGKVCKPSANQLSFYPFVIILYLEKNVFKGKQEEKVAPARSSEPRPKRSRRDSPLEEAIIKEMLTNKVAEGNLSVTSPAELQPTVKEEAVSHSGAADELQMTQYTPEKKRKPETPGILKRLVRNIFPFIFRPPEN